MIYYVGAVQGVDPGLGLVVVGTGVGVVDTLDGMASLG